MKIFRDWTFTWWQAALFKICLMSLGIILGLGLREYLAPLMPVWIALFVSTAVYFLFYIARQKP